jgi:hypothetical protein
MHMRVRIVTFGLTIPADAYMAHAMDVAPGFTAWPGLLGKCWLADTASGTFGGVYLFASRYDADSSRETDLFRGMHANPALRDVSVREYDVLDAPTAITGFSLSMERSGVPQDTP